MDNKTIAIIAAVALIAIIGAAAVVMLNNDKGDDPKPEPTHETYEITVNNELSDISKIFINGKEVSKVTVKNGERVVIIVSPNDGYKIDYDLLSGYYISNNDGDRLGKIALEYKGTVSSFDERSSSGALRYELTGSAVTSMSISITKLV